MAQRHDETVKAGAIAALLAGQSISEVAREYSLPVGTVKGWSANKGTAMDRVEPEKRAQIGALLLDYLAANLIALKAQADVFADKTWLAKQPANELAILHGVATDKAVRLLEALTAGEEEN